MPSESDLRILHDGREHTVIVLGIYGNDVSSLPFENGVEDMEGRAGSEVEDWLAVEVDDCERTCSFRGAFGLEPPFATDADANMVAVSLDHFS